MESTDWTGNREWTVEKSIERWLKVRESSFYAEKSLDSVRTEGRALIKFFGANRLVRSIKPDEMITYLQWRAEGTRAASANTMFTYVLGWISFCHNAGTGIRSDLVANWRRLKAPPVQHTFVPPEAMPKIFQIASDRHPRDRALVAVLWYTGLRATEVHGLTVGDVDMDAGVITANRTKVHDVKRVHMEKELYPELDRWLRAYARGIRFPVVPPTAALIPATGSGVHVNVVKTVPLSDRGMRRITREILTTAGFEGRDLGTHAFRRSAATTLHDQLVEEGDADPLRKTGIFLGHHSRITTEKYLNRGADDGIARDMARQGLLSVSADPVSTVSHATVIDIRSRRRIAG